MGLELTLQQKIVKVVNKEGTFFVCDSRGKRTGSLDAPNLENICFNTDENEPGLIYVKFPSQFPSDMVITAAYEDDVELAVKLAHILEEEYGLKKDQLLVEIYHLNTG